MSPLKLILLFLIFSSSQALWAEEEMPVDLAFEREQLQKLRNFESDIMISRLYRRGTNLIYDCQNGHFACVSAEGFERCGEKRAEDFEKKKMELRCTPFKTYSSLEECASEQVRFAQSLIKKDFCWNLSDDRLFQY